MTKIKRKKISKIRKSRDLLFHKKWHQGVHTTTHHSASFSVSFTAQDKSYHDVLLHWPPQLRSISRLSALLHWRRQIATLLQSIISSVGGDGFQIRIGG